MSLPPSEFLSLAMLAVLGLFAVLAALALFSK